jgi:Tfp pilus assembly protein PilF
MMPAAQPQVVDPVVGFHFAKARGSGSPTYVLMLDADWALDIPAGATDFAVADTMVLPVDVDVLVVYPHAHYVGKSVEGWATLPDGTKQWLVRIPHWDFKWQDVYRVARPVSFPKGTTLSMRWTYDNSSPHPLHLNHAPARVVAGNKTTDEMAHLQIEVRLRTVQDRLALEEAFFRHRLEKNPGSSRFLYGLATALKDQGRWTEAASQYRAALTTAPDYVLAHNNLGAVLMEQGNVDGAISEFQAALRLQSDFAGAHYNLGLAYVSRGRLDEAIRHYREALQYQPDFGEAQNNLGQVLGSLGQLDEALPHLREAVRLIPDSAETHNNLGTGLWFQGKSEEAIAQFRRALEIDPKHIGARKNLSAALQKTATGDAPR